MDDTASNEICEQCLPENPVALHVAAMTKNWPRATSETPRRIETAWKGAGTELGTGRDGHDPGWKRTWTGAASESAGYGD